MLWSTPGISQSATGAGHHIERLDARFDVLVPPAAELELVADGFDWVEGPLWHSKGGYLLFSDVPRNSIFRWDPQGGVSLFLAQSGYTGNAAFDGPEPGSNGLAWDPAGRLVFCQHGDRRISRLESDGRRTVVVSHYNGRRLNSPNDLVYKKNGDLYFTDPPFGLPGTYADPGKELSWQGVYRVDAEGNVTLLTKDVRAPNGLAFSPDERTLYVANADRANATWHAFPVSADGTLGAGRVIFDATSWTKRYAGVPDGMKVDRAGNLFAVGPGGVFVLAPDGTHLGTIVTGVATANVAWGGDGSDLYVVAGSTVYRIRLTTHGT